VYYTHGPIEANTMLKHWLAAGLSALSLWDGLLILNAATWVVFIWAVREMF